MNKNIINRMPVDIGLCFDCTNGNALVERIKSKILHSLQAFNSDIVLRERNLPAGKLRVSVRFDVRFRALGYGEWDTGEEVNSDNVFVDSIDDLRNQIEGLAAYWGGNEPKSTLDAIWYVTKTQGWRENCSKVIFVFTDAPTKSVHENSVNLIPSADANLDVLAQELTVENIKLFLWGKEDSVYESMNRIPRANIIQFEDGVSFYESEKFEKTIHSAIKLIKNSIPIYF